MYHFKSLNLYFSPSTLLILLNLLILTCIYKENYGTYKEKIDIFIDKFNSLLIQKNRFIYRKNRLIIYFALKSNHYSSNEIINAIKKIIS